MQDVLYGFVMGRHRIAGFPYGGKQDPYQRAANPAEGGFVYAEYAKMLKE
jgi:hypothetical protein